MASTVIDQERHRPLEMALLVYERENCSADGHIGSLGHLWRNTTFRTMLLFFMRRQKPKQEWLFTKNHITVILLFLNNQNVKLVIYK